MTAISHKLKCAKISIQRIEEFLAAGGDLKSQAALPVGLEFLGAFAAVAKEFGYAIPKPAKAAPDRVTHDSSPHTG
jgi:hypothetical protein